MPFRWLGRFAYSPEVRTSFRDPTPGHEQGKPGVMKEDQVNILVHGHKPDRSESILSACAEPELSGTHKTRGAKESTWPGLMLHRKTNSLRATVVPMAGNHLMTELALATGAVDMMIVELPMHHAFGEHGGQILPYAQWSSTSDKAKFPGMIHREFRPENGVRDIPGRSSGTPWTTSRTAIPTRSTCR